MFECVINVSEGRSLDVLVALERAAGASLRDRHSDAVHHRSVFTLINDAETLVSDVQTFISAAVAAIDVSHHEGVHPRLGAVDVVPFVPLGTHTLAEAAALRDELAAWVATELRAPVFLYGLVDGVERTLPFVRKHAFCDLAPDVGGQWLSGRTGALTIGARPLLLAWNIWLANTSLERTRSLAARLRQPGVRTLGLDLSGATQVSCNIIDVDAVSLSDLYDQIAAALTPPETITRCELVGLAPRRVLERVPSSRWGEVGLDPSATIEARLAR